MSQKNDFMRTITIKDLWYIFMHRLLIIAIAVVISIATVFFTQKAVYVPEYSSTATIYILRQGNETNTMETNSDFSLALSVVNDCTYLLKSHSVLDEVIKNLALDMTYKELYRKVTAQNPADTRILEVTVVADNPGVAKKIVDEICRIGADKIEEAMGFQQVNLYEYGTLDSNPSNRIRLSTYAVIGIIAGVLVYLAFVIVYMTDDRLKTDEEIEKTLGVSILGEIPNAYHTHRGKYGYYKKYNRQYGANETNKAKLFHMQKKNR